MWLDGTSSESNAHWDNKNGHTEPNGGTYENCAHIRPTYLNFTLNDSRCTNLFFALCELYG